MKHNVLIALAAAVLPLAAHHPFSEDFDSSRPVTLTGTIESVQWAEPHVMLTLHVTDKANPGEWELEAASRAALQKNGLTEQTFRKGTAVTVQAYRSRDGSKKASARSVQLADGKTYAVADPMEDGGPPPVISDAAQPPVKGKSTR